MMRLTMKCEICYVIYWWILSINTVIMRNIFIWFEYNIRSDSNSQELKNEDLIHRLITFIKTHPNPYVMKLIEVDFMIFLYCSVFSILSLFQRLLWLLTTIFDSVYWLMILYLWREIFILDREWILEICSWVIWHSLYLCHVPLEAALSSSSFSRSISFSTWRTISSNWVFPIRRY